MEANETIVKRRSSGKVSIILTGILGLAAILFGLYVWVNMSRSGVRNPTEIGTPLLFLGILIVAITLIVIIAKAASR